MCPTPQLRRFVASFSCPVFPSIPSSSSNLFIGKKTTKLLDLLFPLVGYSYFCRCRPVTQQYIYIYTTAASILSYSLYIYMYIRRYHLLPLLLYLFSLFPFLSPSTFLSSSSYLVVVVLLLLILVLFLTFIFFSSPPHLCIVV